MALVQDLLEHYVELQSPHEYIAVALWVLHAHIFRYFTIAPRLALISPVRGCGKTVLLDLLTHLLPRAYRVDSITPAAIYHLIDREGAILLIDEADNAGLRKNGLLLAVLNGGHRKGSRRALVAGDGVRLFSTFCPMAFAAIGTLPLPLIHRCVTIRMQRATGTRKLWRLDAEDPVLVTVYGAIRHWQASNPTLDRDPALSGELRNRLGDNWRGLIAIADAFGPDWGARARAAAVALSERQEEDAAVQLLTDIRSIFDASGVDRIFSETLVGALNDLDDAGWSEWRGVHGTQPPRRLSQGELARLLSPFGIRPRILPLGSRQQRGASHRGYRREQFEAAWRAYCSTADTPTHGSGVSRLRLV